MKRSITKEFVTELLKGKLKGLLEYVKKDNTLDFEIRSNKINIYYRGGSALRVSEKKNSPYDFYFDEKYLKEDQRLNINPVEHFIPTSDWFGYFSYVKQAMDLYFTKHKAEEREYQQLLVRENNYSTVANATDYFIIDIEYANHRGARFDIIAMEWESDSTVRKLTKGCRPKLVVIEMKFGDGALKNSSGIQKHIDDFVRFNSSTSDIRDFKHEMASVFMQKWKLGLIPCLIKNARLENELLFAENIELLFLFSNHDPAKSVLFDILDGLEYKNIKFITSNFTGYGLFKENVFNYDKFMNRFASQI